MTLGMLQIIVGLAGAAIALGSVVLIVVIIWRRRPVKHLNTDYFEAKWKELQQGLRSKKNWATSIIAADDLLGEALKKKGYHSKKLGERLMKAQRSFSDNDGVWFGHKLRKEIDDNPKLELTQKDVKRALLGLRQGLKDIGALKK